MTILDLISAHPMLFRTDQTWYHGEAFTTLDLPPLARMPRKIIARKAVSPDDADELTDAVLLLELYTRYPNDAIWNRYLWCADVDSHGQRIFIGKNNGVMEIHRHLHITPRFGVPIW